MKDIILYDGNCSFCELFKNITQKLDWFNQLDWMELQRYQGVLFSQEELEAEIHLVTASGKVLKGFRAIRRILWQLPLALPASLVLYLPFSKWFGDKAYQFLSRHRTEMMDFLNKFGIKTVRCCA